VVTQADPPPIGPFASDIAEAAPQTGSERTAPMGDLPRSRPLDQKECHMNGPPEYRDPWISPRIKIAALWASMLFVFVYVDLFSLYRADVRADIEAGEISAFSIGQGFLLGVTAYVALPSLMVFLSLVLSVKVTRMTNIVLAVLYALTIVGSAVGEWNYYILGSVIEVALLAGIAYYAWTWPKATDAAASANREATASA
jgi:uncharacterized protein DUF6326